MKRLIVSCSIVLTLGIALAWMLCWSLNETPLLAQQHAQDVITVCQGGGCDYSTIQQAVDAADPGDEIFVATGVYTGAHTRNGTKQVLYISQTLTIRGGYSTDFATRDPGTYSTTLDANQEGRAIYMTADISPTLDGLSIMNGSGVAGGGSSTAGGGIYAVNAHPTISGCRVYSNTGTAGAGIYFYGSDNITLIGNHIFDNAATAANGGGVYAYASNNVLYTGNHIYRNRATNGGGLYLGDGDGVAITGNEVYSNTATSQYGGGMMLNVVGNTTISGNRIYSNTTNAYGGGLHLSNSPAPVLEGNLFYSNTARWDGGGLYLNRSDALAEGNIVRWNKTVVGEGSGLAIRDCAPVLTNTVVADNEDQGGGLGFRIAIYIEGASPHFLHLTMARHPSYGIYIVSYGSITSSVYLTNSIIYSHSYGVVIYSTLPDINEVYLYNTLSYSNTVPFKKFGSSIGYDYGTVTGDPVFLPDGYHIGPDSAAIDQGLDIGVHTDVDGGTRPAGLGYDIGADERPHTLYLPLLLRRFP